MLLWFMCMIIELASTKYRLVSTDLKTLLPKSSTKSWCQESGEFLVWLCISEVLKLSLIICSVVHSGVGNFTVELTKYSINSSRICKDFCSCLWDALQFNWSGSLITDLWTQYHFGNQWKIPFISTIDSICIIWYELENLWNFEELFLTFWKRREESRLEQRPKPKPKPSY